MSNFSKYIPKDLAKELWKFGMPLCADVGSFELDANDAIRYAMQLKNNI